MDYVTDLVVTAAVTATVNIIGRLLSRGMSKDVPISDDLMVRLSVLDTVAARAATDRDDRAETTYVSLSAVPPITVRQGLLSALDVVRGQMARCKCHQDQDELGPVWVWGFAMSSGGASIVTGEAFVRNLCTQSRRWYSVSDDEDDDLPLFRVDDLFCALPFICPNEFMATLLPPTRMSNCVRVPYRGLDVFEDKTGFVHPIKGVNHTRMMTVPYKDSLGVYDPPENLYKSENMQSYVNCVCCSPEALHGFNSAFFNNALVSDRRHAAARGIVHAGIELRHKLHLIGNPKRIQVTAWDSSYCPFEMVTSYGNPLVILVITTSDRDVVEEAGHIGIMIDVAVMGLHVCANLRLWMCYAAPAGTICHITNAYARTNWISDASIDPIAPVEMPGCSYRNGVVCSGLIVSGATNLGVSSPPSRVAKFLGLYGLEEACLERSTIVVTRADHIFGQFSVDHPFNPKFRRVNPICLRSMMQDSKFASARGTTRAQTLSTISIVYSWKRGVEAMPSWTTTWGLPLGIYRDIGPVIVQDSPGHVSVKPGKPQSIAGAVGVSIGVLNWFVFGSHGDVVPVLALARRLQGLGIQVHVIKVHSDEEGKKILAYAEKGQILKAAPAFLRTMATAATAPGVVFGPPEFSAVDTGVNFRPPSTVVKPADFGAGALVNFLIDSVFRGWAPIINIGAYDGIDWFPRSADGVNFLTKFSGGKRPIDIMLAWGSSTLEPPLIDGAVEVLPGDHFSQFKTAKIVVCHGGAGTVQTAASAGARVVTASDVLDRRYRDVLDSGRGVTPGSDPDAIMLSLLPHSSLVWIWAWKHSWTMFYRALRLGFKWIFGPSIWVMIAMTVKSVIFVIALPRVRVVFTLSFVSTIFSTVLIHFVGPFWAMIGGPQIENLLFYIFAHTGMTYSALILTALSGLAKVSLSPMTWGLILAGHPWLAVPLTLGLNYFQVGPLVFAELFSFFIGGRDDLDSTQCAKVGISWAYENSNIPIFHTRFLSPDESVAVEGVWVNQRQEMGAMYSLRMTTVRSIPYEWRFTTRLPWTMFENYKTLSAPYSPLWNCQSSMMYATRGAWSLLGMSLVVMAPMGIFMLLSMIIVMALTLIAIVLTDVLPVIDLIITACGFEREIGYTHAIIHNVLNSLLTQSGGWYESALCALVGLSTGWGSSDVDDLILKKILFAQTRLELLTVVNEDGTKFSALDLKFYNAKFALVADN